MAQKVYASVEYDGGRLTLCIDCSVHCNDRASEKDYNRFCFDGDFVVGRLSTLLENDEFLNVLLNGIRMGESFVVQDEDMGLHIAVGYNYDTSEGIDMLTPITTRRKLRLWDGQKVIRVVRNVVTFAAWNRTSKRLEVISLEG